MIKKLTLSLLAIIFVFLALKPVVAVDCEGEPPKDADQLRQYIDNCQSKITSLRQEQQTLKSALNLINSRINLTQAQIKSTTTQIQQLETDITSLSQVIGDLNVNLDQLTQVFISRVRELYKTRDTSPTVMLFASNYSTFQNRL